MKVYLVEKHSDVNGISEREVDVEAVELETLSNCDVVFDKNKHYHIRKKAFGTDGCLLLFVERDNSYSMDDQFIEYYFSERSN